MNLINGVLDKFPESVRDDLKGARLPSGKGIFNDPDIMRGFVSLALENNPSGVTVTGQTGDQPTAMVDRYNEIVKYQREHRAEYNKNHGMQAEQRDLIDALRRQGIMDDEGKIDTSGRTRAARAA